MVEWSKTQDSSSCLLWGRGFKSHSCQCLFFFVCVAWFFVDCSCLLLCCSKTKKKVLWLPLPGLEPGSSGLQPLILNPWTTKGDVFTNKKHKKNWFLKLGKIKGLAKVGFDPTTYGLWAHRANHCATLLLWYHTHTQMRMWLTIVKQRWTSLHTPAPTWCARVHTHTFFQMHRNICVCDVNIRESVTCTHTHLYVRVGVT